MTSDTHTHDTYALITWCRCSLDAGAESLFPDEVDLTTNLKGRTAVEIIENNGDGADRDDNAFPWSDRKEGSLPQVPSLHGQHPVWTAGALVRWGTRNNLSSAGLPDRRLKREHIVISGDLLPFVPLSSPVKFLLELVSWGSSEVLCETCSREDI